MLLPKVSVDDKIEQEVMSVYHAKIIRLLGESTHSMTYLLAYTFL